MNSYMKQMEESSKKVASLNQQISSATNHESQLRQQLKTDRKKNQDLKQNNAGKNKIEPINNPRIQSSLAPPYLPLTCFFLTSLHLLSNLSLFFLFHCTNMKTKTKTIRIKITKINNKLTFNPFTQYIQIQHHIST